ncbi:3-ketosteroid 9-alpha-monooxygenase [Nocardia seriolae]|uniref:Rieske-type oxygenase n=1 Tax=Nocardia seriolae TaxID=37332 RepID=A0ABC8ARG2_9NOCA|nr:Rieske 2Fe-2S domain-containing protein [Nocardia seriolae]APA96743.1 3-ketosteroid 9-alpha-monooxygenase [Nocardia seriolae]
MQPYPASWYRVADSIDVVPGIINRLHYLGRDLIAYRTSSGRAVVADAHCPHLGADLTDGSLDNGDLICPFHAWRFGASGRCIHIPYSDKTPAAAILRTYPVREFDGVIAIYWDESGREPEWEPNGFPEDDNTNWTPFARKAWRISTHVQDIVENVPDAAHQAVIHNAVGIPDFEFEIAGHRISGVTRGTYAFPGGPPGGVRVTGHFENLGLGVTNIRLVDRSDGVELNRQLQLCRTPVDGDLVEATIAQRTRGFGDPEADAALNAKIVHATWEDFERDIPIWEKKIYRALPSRVEFNRGERASALCDGEGAIVQFRNWSRQFYTNAECGV